MTKQEAKIFSRIININFDLKVNKWMWIINILWTIAMVILYSFILRGHDVNIISIVCCVIVFLNIIWCFKKLINDGKKIEDNKMILKFEIQSYLIEKMGEINE